MRSKVYLIGDDIISLEALQLALVRRGFEVHYGTIKTTFDESRIREINPEVVVWDEDLIEMREGTLFDLWKYCEITFRSVFILSATTIRMLGMGMSYGIRGFVHRKGGLDDLEKCINKVLNDTIFISPSLSGAFHVERRGYRNENDNDGIDLTNQEKRILRFVNKKKTSREIADILNISCKTVQNHRQNISNKLGLKGRNSLFEFSQVYFE